MDQDFCQNVCDAEMIPMTIQLLSFDFSGKSYGTSKYQQKGGNEAICGGQLSTCCHVAALCFDNADDHTERKKKGGKTVNPPPPTELFGRRLFTVASTRRDDSGQHGKRRARI